VTGQGGPSGTGKRPLGETILPQPIFLQDNIGNKPSSQRNSSETSKSANSQSPSSNALKGPTTPKLTESEGEPIDEFSNNDQSSSQNMNEEKQSFKYSLRHDENSENSKLVLDTKEPLELQLPYHNPNSFNGVTWNAVFPVPVSSLSVSIWSSVGKYSETGLGINPFSGFVLPISELLDLTLPPVDGISLPPKPSAVYYSVSVAEVQFRRKTDELKEIHLMSGVDQKNSEHQNDSSSSPTSSNPSYNALRQLFPTVNLSYGPSNITSSNHLIQRLNPY
jgi:hypothetical protein